MDIQTIQTIELAGRRFVVPPEEDFQTLQQQQAGTAESEISPRLASKPKFSPFNPIKVSGISAFEMLLQDRR